MTLNKPGGRQVSSPVYFLPVAHPTDPISFVTGTCSKRNDGEALFNSDLVIFENNTKSVRFFNSSTPNTLFCLWIDHFDLILVLEGAFHKAFYIRQSAGMVMNYDI